MQLQVTFKQQKRYRCRHIYIHTLYSLNASSNDVQTTKKIPMQAHIYIHILYSFNVALSDVQTAIKIPMQAHIYKYTILNQCSL